ncbi:MAG: SAM-dependent methyltransferase [Opitutales bacterium]
MSKSYNEVADQAEKYYDSSDADNFYFNIWGGEDIHVGWYESDDEPIPDASRRTVAKMADRLSHWPAGTRVLDIGAGYGGSARYLAKNHDFDPTCLNISVVQNERDRQMNREQGLADRIDVHDGSFEDLPFEDNSYDVVWCQDSILHSAQRKRVFEEVDRVLKPGGEFIFTDPMQKPGVSKDILQPVLDRIHLDSMGSFDLYEEFARDLGWETLHIERATEKLVMHYSRVLQELERRQDEMEQHCSREYIEKMKTGLRHWVQAGRDEALAWGILHFKKPG